MKNIYKYILFTFLTGSLFAFVGCDVNDDFDNFREKTRPKNISPKTVEMTPALYLQMTGLLDKDKDADAIKFFKAEYAFSAEYPAATYALPLIKALFPTADETCPAILHHKNFGNRTPLAEKYSKGPHIVSQEEYNKVWNTPNAAMTFNPKKLPEKHIPNLLKTAYPNAVKDDLKNVSYFYSEEDVKEAIAVGDTFFQFDFEGDDESLPGWANTPVLGKRLWQFKTFNNNKYIQFSANGSKEINDAYLITPKITLANKDGLYLGFDVAVGYYNGDGLTVWVSTNYNGSGTKEDIAAATWVNVSSNYTIPKEPATGYGSLASAGLGSLNQFKGQDIHIAFRYRGDDVNTPKVTTTYQLDNIVVFEGTLGYDVDNKEVEYALYQFNNEKNEWAPYKSSSTDLKVLLLQAEDYYTMGEKNPYMSQQNAIRKLPIFLAANHSYDDPNITTYIVVLYTSADHVVAQECIRNNGVWTNRFAEMATTQFVVSSVGWIFDPTFQIDFGGNAAAYQTIVDYVKVNQGVDNPALLDSRGNAEFYYGFNAYYQNVTYRSKDRVVDPLFPSEGTNEDRAAFMDKRTYEGLIAYLNVTYPDAQPEVSGAKQYALIRNVKIFSNPMSLLGNEHFTYKFQYIKEGKWMVLTRQSLEDADNFTEYNKPEE